MTQRAVCSFVTGTLVRQYTGALQQATRMASTSSIPMWSLGDSSLEISAGRGRLSDPCFVLVALIVYAFMTHPSGQFFVGWSTPVG